MPTASELKVLIDEQITNKVDPYSIDNVDVGTRLKEIIDLTKPLQFASSANRISYLTNPSAQPFQLADDLEDGNKYFINKAGTDWVLVATASGAVNEEIIVFAGQSSLTIAWDATRKTKFGSNANFIVETKDDDGKYRRKWTEVYADDIDDPAFYYVDLGGAGMEGKLTIR